LSESKILVSGHNPITGPRHLGHFVSTMKELRGLQKDYECIIVIDDLLAYLIFCNMRDKIINRTFFTIRDILASGFDTKRGHIIITSMLPESLELMTLLNSFIDFPYHERIHRESFCGNLKPFHRSQIGLGKYTSMTEFVYPITGLPALTLGLKASAFQGGEAIAGYMSTMEEMSKSVNEINGDKILITPQLVYANNPFLCGIDGKYMIQENSIILSADTNDIEARVNKIHYNKVLIDWYNALDNPNKAHSLNIHDTTTNDSKKEMTEFLIEILKPFRDFHITNGDIMKILKDGAQYAKSLINQTNKEVKMAMNIPTFT